MAYGKWRGKWALVTGSSAGIGKDFAKELAESGVNLVLTARRLDRLEALAKELKDAHGVDVRVVSSDLGSPDGVTTVTKMLDAEGLQVDILVNNAGFGIAGEFHETGVDKALGMVQVNISSLVALTHALLPGMRARGFGSIILVGSVNAFMPVAHFAVYSATKAFVRSFGEAMACECAGTGVTVTNVHPGGTATEFVEVADMKMGDFFESQLMTSRAVARIGLSSAHGGAVSVVTGLMNKMTVLMLWAMPPFMVQWGAKAFFSRMH
ncbi:MAG: SDR family oxidoreductase [Deltaproteobacteria bacterium]|nr:SDR family oxidoreductase [Deltaproteobacteria bacterium]